MKTKEEMKLKRLLKKGRAVFDSRVFSIPYAGQMYEKLAIELYYKMKPRPSHKIQK